MEQLRKRKKGSRLEPRPIFASPVQSIRSPRILVIRRTLIQRNMLYIILINYVTIQSFILIIDKYFGLQYFFKTQQRKTTLLRLWKKLQKMSKKSCPHILEPSIIKHHIKEWTVCILFLFTCFVHAWKMSYSCSHTFHFKMSQSLSAWFASVRRSKFKQPGGVCFHLDI